MSIIMFLIDFFKSEFKYAQVISFLFDCERYKNEKDALNRSPEMKDYYFKHREIFNFAAAHSGLEMSSNDINKALLNSFNLNDILSIEVCKRIE